jgi:hypothetical protein
MATSGKSWEWHNTEVGVGYQAKHVVRQKSFAPITDKIIDMRGPVPKRISNCAGLSTTVKDTIIRNSKSETPSSPKRVKSEKSESLASIDKKKLKKMEKKSRRKEEKAAKAARKEVRREMRKEKKKD